MMVSIDYELIVDTDEIDRRLPSLLHLNMRKFGTISNTVAAATKLEGVESEEKNTSRFLKPDCSRHDLQDRVRQHPVGFYGSDNSIAASRVSTTAAGSTLCRRKESRRCYRGVAGSLSVRSEAGASARSRPNSSIEMSRHEDLSTNDLLSTSAGDMSFRSRASARRSISTVGSRSVTSIAKRFQPPGSCMVPSGIGWPPPPVGFGALRTSRRSPRDSIANGGAGCISSLKSNFSV